jgi:HEAT repeat protein
VLRARAAVDAALEESPSLRPDLDSVIKRETKRIRSLVADALAQYGETPRVDRDQVAYRADQVLGPGFPEE